MRHFRTNSIHYEARNVAKFTTMYLFGHNQDHAQKATKCHESLFERLIKMDIESSIILWLPIYQLCMYIPEFSMYCSSSTLTNRFEATFQAHTVMKMLMTSSKLQKRNQVFFFFALLIRALIIQTFQIPGP